MNKTKNLKGMTLVEVVVAMSIFSFMTLAITMSFAAAMKFNARNQKRDYELKVQQGKIETGYAAGLEVYDNSFDPSATPQKRELEFKKSDGTALTFSAPSDAFKGLVEYNATKTQLNDGDINFQIKKFSTSNLSSSVTSADPANNNFKLVINNTSTDPVEIRVFMRDGATGYIGDYDTGYKHKSSLFIQSLPGYDPDAEIEASEYDKTDDSWKTTTNAVPSTFVLGLHLPPADGLTGSPASSISVQFVKHNSVVGSETIARSSFVTAASGVLEFNYDGSSLSPK